MANPLTADDIIPMVASLPPEERARVLRFIATHCDDAAAYRSVPPAPGEFATEEEPLAWEAEGWEDLG